MSELFYLLMIMGLIGMAIGAGIVLALFALIGVAT